MKRQTLTMAQKDDLYKQITKPIICHTLADIKQAIQAFLSRDNTPQQVSFTAKLPWQHQQESGEDTVTGSSKDVSLYSLLIEGMDVVKKRLDITARIQEMVIIAEEQISNNMTPWDVDNLRFRVDSLIERKLGGKRKGLCIRWEILEGTYEWDPYSKKFYQVTND